ncbi:MAG: SCO family protein [Candidatus Eremiobacteraeota bacterium]|nr:SCO family protein [Candidatus Eremiobacteraeota bacterium]
MIAVLAAIVTLIPVHGLVIGTLPDRTVVVRTDSVTGTLPSLTRRYRVVRAAPLSSGTQIDALLDGSTNPPTLRDAIPAGPFTPGLPEAARAVPVRLGGALPAADLVDANGHLVRLDQTFRDKTVLLSFIFTRCPDRTLCPAISGKFAYLQARLDSRRFALVEITLDPQYDSPAQLRAYGASYGANDRVWTLLTGTGSTITRLLDAFGISSLRVSTANFLHGDKLFVVAPNGRVADIVENATWDPGAALAAARAADGLSSNPIERLRLALIAGAVALCGGSETAGIALLELSLFALCSAGAFVALWFVARVLWHPEQGREA